MEIASTTLVAIPPRSQPDTTGTQPVAVATRYPTGRDLPRRNGNRADVIGDTEHACGVVGNGTEVIFETSSISITMSAYRVECQPAERRNRPP